MVRRNGLGFREVMKPIEAFGMTVLHDENGTGLAIVTRNQNEIIRAKVKHREHLTGDAE